MKHAVLVISLCYLFASCGDGKEKSSNSNLQASEKVGSVDGKDYDPKLGEGKFTKVDLGAGIDDKMANHGKNITGVKCLSCHKMTTEQLVGPGWAGVTERRTPEWIMNFITNPEAMIDKDPALQEQLEICLVRMPNQAIKDDEARSILEYMRQNDLAK